MRAGQFSWCLLFAVASCTGLSVGNTPVAIEFVSPPDSIQAGHTDTLIVQAVNRDDKVVPATIYLISLNPDTIAVDSVAHTITGDTGLTYPVVGRVVATSGNLQSQPLSIRVTAP